MAKIQTNPGFNACSHYLQASKGSCKTTKKLWRHHFHHHKSMGVVLRLSRADNSMVGGPVWMQFKLLLDIMHVQYTYEFKMEPINSNQEKVAKSIFRRSRAANSVVCGQIWPNFKLVQALMHVIITCKYEKDPIKTAEKK